MSNLAIVVVAPHASPPPSTAGAASQQQCAYSVPVDPGNSTPTYQCLTQEQWDARQQLHAQQDALQSKQLHDWWHHHWTQVLWVPPVGIMCLIAFVVTVDLIGTAIEKKRHPDHFDQYGNKKWPYDGGIYL